MAMKDMVQHAWLSAGKTSKEGMEIVFVGLATSGIIGASVYLNFVKWDKSDHPMANVLISAPRIIRSGIPSIGGASVKLAM